jgi:hypothetical protein
MSWRCPYCEQTNSDWADVCGRCAERPPWRKPTNSDLHARIRTCLKRWAARYASSPHAKKHVAETRELIREIDATR